MTFRVNDLQRHSCKIFDLRILLTLGALSFLVNLGYGIVLPVLPTLADATPFDVGLMYTVFSATKLAAQLYGGAAADRFGAGPAMRLGVAIYAASLAGLAAAHSVAAVLVFRVVEGVAVGLCVPAMSSIVLGTGDEASFTRRHGIVLGLGGVGMVSGPVIGLAAGRDHVREAMVVIAAATVAGALFAPKVAPPSTTDSASPLAEHDEAAFEFRSLIRYVASPGFAFLVAPLAFGKLVFGVLQPLLPIHAAREHMSDATVAMLFALTGILFAATQPLVGALRSRFSSRTLALACLLASAASVGAMALFDGPIGFSTAYLTYVVFGSMLFAANSGLVGETFHAEQQDHGKVFGAMHSVTDAAMLLGPPLLLAVYDRDARVSFATLGALGLVFALAFVVGPWPRRDPVSG